VLLQLGASNVGLALVPHSIYQNFNAFTGCVAVELAEAWVRRSLKIAARTSIASCPSCGPFSSIFGFSGRG
jgi:hypothetical protein